MTDSALGERVMSYPHCEREFNQPKSRLRIAFDDLAFLFEGFHP
jgi:hypothetical protein